MAKTRYAVNGQAPQSTIIQAINYAAYQALRYIRPESEAYLREKFASLTNNGYPGLDPSLVGTVTEGDTPPVRTRFPPCAFHIGGMLYPC
jgi:hypothetical protein